MDSFPPLAESVNCIPMGPVCTNFIKENKIKIPVKGIPKLCPVFESTRLVTSLHGDECWNMGYFRWFHVQEIKELVSIFRGMLHFTNITQIFETRLEHVFAEPISKLVKMRRECAARGDLIGANTAKAIANFSFGTTIRKVEGLTVTKVISEDKLARALTKSQFYLAQDLCGGLIELTTKPRRRTLNQPFTVGLSVLMLSKLRLKRLLVQYVQYIDQTSLQTAPFRLRFPGSLLSQIEPRSGLYRYMFSPHIN
ncbi:MAG: hypothetical protein GY820_27940 [Gammaproteobacteria bacterium]|nr:hypothetical protein [Gammaproteobacteria bacterium]